MIIFLTKVHSLSFSWDAGRTQKLLLEKALAQ